MGEKSSMLRKFGFVWLLGLLLVGSVHTASALGPVNPIGAVANTQPDLLDVSFWGRPYPYGYTGWGPCMRYVEVQTRWGVRLRRVWVCR
jgi:hypothetical protein